MSWGKCKKNTRLAEHFIAFCNEFNKFNNTGAQMLDSIYHLTLKLNLISYYFREKTLGFCHMRDVKSGIG